MLNFGKSRSESFETQCWRVVEISWTDRVKNEELLQGVKKKEHLTYNKNRTGYPDSS